VIAARPRAAAIGVALTVIACTHPQRLVPLVPEPTRAIALVLAEAQLAAAGGRYAEADQALVAFDSAFAGTPEALETVYWRALFKLDPANKDASTAEAVGLLDSYLGTGEAQPHRTEVAALRRLVAQREALARDLDAARLAAVKLAAQPVVIAPPRVDEEEVNRLRDSLARSNAELDRIKRRLAAPRP
jgi:hypothetical protein